MAIHLVRHGRAAAGAEDLDPGLDDIGHEQARETARFFRGKTVSRLVVSPMRRTRETMAPIAEALGLQPEVREEVSEVFDPAMPGEQRSAMIGPFMQSTWGEQPRELRAWRNRAVETVRQLAEEAARAGGDLVVVSHYIAICAVVGEAMGDDRVVPVPIPNCSISTLSLDDGQFVLERAGAVAHLPEHLVTGVSQAMLGPRH